MFRETTFADGSRTDSLDDSAAVLAMDEESFHGFYERTARGLWMYLTRITGDRQIADDLLQETFYRFLRASTKYESEKHRRNSLYRIATNLARDARRRSLTHAFSSVGGDEIEQVADRDTGSAEKRAEFNRAMSHLNPRERAMLWLAYAEGASHREIAEILGLRASSLKPLLFRVRRKLARLLGGSKDGSDR